MSARARASSALRSLPWPIRALTAAAAASLIWIVLAFATGLIYHLMPAGPPLAAAGAVGWATERVSWRARLGSTAIGLGASLATALLLSIAGRPLDVPTLTILPAIVGSLLALALLRWLRG